MAAQMITAQALLDGASVYMTKDGKWSESFAAGGLLPDDAAVADAMTKAKESVAGQIVVGPYPIEVELDGGAPHPSTTRERIRASHNITVEIDQGSWTSWIAG